MLVSPMCSQARWRLGGLILIASALAVALLLLSGPFRLPIGVSYSDIYMFADAAYRMSLGEVPHRDFSLPVGALPFIAYAAALPFYPEAQLLLTAQLPLSAVFLLSMAVLVWAAVRPAVMVLAAGILALLALMPFNWGDAEPTLRAEADGFGLYNREAGLALYVIVCALWLETRRKAAAMVIAAMLFLLWNIKITNFMAALGMLIPASFLAGLGLRACGIIAVGAIAGPLLQLLSGTLLPCIHDMWQLASAAASRGSITRRAATELGQNFWLLAPLVAAGCAMLLSEWRRILRSVIALPATPLSASADLLRLRTSNFLVLALLAILVESQNTGSQAYAFVIPALIGAFDAFRSARALRIIRAGVLLSFPILVCSIILARVALVASADLRPFGSDRIAAYRAAAPPGLLAAAAQMMRAPETLLGTPLRFENEAVGEILYLMLLDEGLKAFTEWQAKHRLVGTIASLDFVDPWPSITGLHPSPGLPVVFDPDRTIGTDLVPRLIAAWSRTDIILARRCMGIKKLVDLAGPALSGRHRVPLTPCWDMFVRTR